MRIFTRPPLQGRTVLVVDDDAYQVEALAEILHQEGMEAEIETSGVRALARIARRCPDLLIIDAKMPKMSGLEVIAASREIRQDLPIVLLTGYTADSPVVEAARAVGAAYVEKPVNIRALLEVIGAMLAPRVPALPRVPVLPRSRN